MTELEFLRWTTKVGADAALAVDMLQASEGHRFPHREVGSIKPVDLSWVPAAAALDPATIDGYTLWNEGVHGDFHDTQASVAIHEASHLAMNEQIRRPDTLLAAALSEGGYSGISNRSTGPARAEVMAAAPDWVVLTSAWYAGRLGELMASGAQWTRPITDPGQTDFQRSHNVLMLQPVDHDHLLINMMAQAQQFALRVLHARWGRVVEVAQHLLEHGTYACVIEANNQINPSALKGSGAGGPADELGCVVNT